MPETSVSISQPSLEFAFTLHVEIGAPQTVGATPNGTSVYIPITGGTITGPTLSGRVLPGADRLTVRNDGVRFVSALYEVELEDGTIVTVRNEGPSAEGKPVLTTPTFVAPKGNHDWLNKSVFVSTVQASVAEGYVSIRVDRLV